MLKPLWFLIKLVVFVGIVTWLSARPGDVVINWNGWLVETTFGFLLALGLTICVVFAVLYHLWRRLVKMPAFVRQYKIIRAREKGYEAVTKGLVAVAAGDPNAAEKQSKRAASLIPDAPLAGLLSAQAALLNGNHARARVEFETLLEDKNAAFFGLRGLMNEAVKENDQEQALLLLRVAENLHPKREWILRALFDAETHACQWIAADKTLTKAVRLGVFDRETGNAHHQCLLVARAQQALAQGMDSQALTLAKKAYRLDVGFTPASTLYAKMLVKRKKNRAAIKVIEEAWPQGPHPDLEKLWAKLAPKVKGKTQEDKNRNALAWFKRLYSTATYRPESNLLMGHAAMDLKMYHEARDWLKAAGAYRDLAELEKRDGRHDVTSREWLELAAEARPGPNWHCDACGYKAVDWNPLCPNCQSFNTIDWRTSDKLSHRLPEKPASYLENTGFIEPPSS